MKNERGVTLIEVVIALGVLGVLAVGFFNGLSGSSKAVITTDERATAESLARTEMEYVVDQKYLTHPWSYVLPTVDPPPSVTWEPLNTLPNGYSAEVSASGLADNRTGIQRVAVVISHLGKPIVTSGGITLEDYRVK